MKLEINHKKKTGKITNMWRLNNIQLENQWVDEEIKGYIKKKYLETSENENTTFQNFGNAAKLVPKEKFIVIYAYLKKEEKS